MTWATMLILAALITSGDVATTGACLTGDIDGDGIVEVNDLLAVVGDWGPCPDCPADIDGNDIVDINDLLIVLASFGTAREAPWFPMERLLTPEVGKPSAVSLDWDDDGDQDLIAPSVEALHAFLNDGCGQMTYAFAIPVDWIQQDTICLVDTDGDDDLDILITDFAADVITIMTREGMTIESQVDVSIGDGPSDIAAADFDDDGDMDLAVTAQNENLVMILMNDGAGGFTVVDDRNGGGGPSSLALEDVDADGDVDLAVTNNGNMLVWFNDGEGVFGGADVYNSTGLLEIADLDMDGWPDLIFSPPHVPGGSDLVVRYGTGEGLFGEEATYPVDANGAAVADVDADGDPDLVLAPGPAIALNLGDRVFEVLSHAPGIGNRQRPLVDDFNGDGMPDVVLHWGHFVTYMSGPFDLLVLAPPVVMSVVKPQDIELVDLDGDKDLDVLTVSDDPPNGPFGDVWISIFENDGDGQFVRPIEITVPEVAGSSGTCQIEAADVDGDGDPDLLFGDESVGVLLNEGGALAFGHVIALPTTGGVEGMTVADFNDDGAVDFAVNHRGPSQTSIFINDGVGAFALSDTLEGFAKEIVAADVQGDGQIDLIYGSPGTLGVWTNPGAAAPEVVEVPTGVSTPTIDAEDLDDDGVLEIVLASSNLAEQTRVFHFLGDTLVPQGDFLVEGSGTLIADLNADGLPDVVVAEDSIGFAVYPGIVGGTIGAPRHYYWGADSTDIRVGDVDGDGVADLVMMRESFSAFLVVRGYSSR